MCSGKPQELTLVARSRERQEGSKTVSRTVGQLIAPRPGEPGHGPRMLLLFPHRLAQVPVGSCDPAQ